MNPHTYEQLIYNTGSKIIQWEKDSLFHNGCQEDCRRMQKYHAELFFHTMHKIKSKWIEVLKIRRQTLKFLEVNLGCMPFDISLFGCVFDVNLLGYVSLDNRNKSRNKQLELYLTKNLLYIEGR